MSARPVTPDDVRTFARVVGIPVTPAECEIVAPRLQHYVRCGQFLVGAMESDLLPTDDPRWFDVG